MKRTLWVLLIASLLWAGQVPLSPAAFGTAAGKLPTAVELAERAEYHLDATGTLDYEAVLAGSVPFASHAGESFQFSFRRATLWIKCPLFPPPRGERGLRSRQSLLVIDNASLASLTLYVPVLRDGAPETLVLRGGWQNAGVSDEARFLYPAFVIPEHLDTATEVAERIRARFAEALATRWTEIVPLTVSIGVCTWQRAETAEDLFIRCDRALYRAKEAGRNRVWRA